MTDSCSHFCRGGGEGEKVYLSENNLSKFAYETFFGKRHRAKSWQVLVHGALIDHLKVVQRQKSFHVSCKKNWQEYSVDYPGIDLYKKLGIRISKKS